MISKKAMDAFTEFYQTAGAAGHLSEREGVLVRLAAAMALGCSP